MTDQFVKLFDYMGNKVRIIMQDGEPWFLGMDVLTILDLSSMPGSAAMAYRRLDPADKSYVSRTYVGLSPGRQVTIISEGGLYQLIMRSDKEAAKPFQRWVTHTVLPTLRKDKQYNVGEEKVATGEMTIDEMELMVFENLRNKAARYKAERDAALETVAKQDERLNFITVAEYLALDKRYMPHGQKTKLGQMAKLMCEARGLKTTKAHTTYTDGYGRTHNVQIGQYPREVLEEAEGLLAA